MALDKSPPTLMCYHLADPRSSAQHCGHCPPPPFLFRWSLLLGTALGSTTLILVSGLNKELGISDHTFMLSDSVMLTVLGQVRSS